MGDDKFPTGKVYKELRGHEEKVYRRRIFFNNGDRPRDLFILWMLCQRRKFVTGVEENCSFCTGKESIEHLSFIIYVSPSAATPPK